MADVARAPSSEPLPRSHPASYSATTAETPLFAAATTAATTAAPAAHSDADDAPVETSAFGLRALQIPTFITAPIESLLGMLGKFARGATDLLGGQGHQAVSRARPWLEFFDLSAFKPADGFRSYVDRLRANAPYFVFNYVIVGFALSVFSVITKPVSLVGAALLIWLYFQFFGAETADNDFTFFGFSLDTHEKIGCMVTLGLIFFWITAGGLEIIFSVITASLFVALVHGSFRKPSPDALPSAAPEV